MAQAFVRMRSAVSHSFPSWESAAKHQSEKESTTHTVVIGIDRRPTMRDLALFDDPVGFVVMDTIELASFLLAKTVVYSEMPEGRDLCFAPIQKGKVLGDAGGLTVLPGDSQELQQWRSVVEGDESVVSIVGHASEDYLRLSSNELVCGRRTVRPPEISGKRLPTCMVDGGCVLPGLRQTGPQDVPGRVFFANACLTLKVDGGVFDGGDSYTVSQRFLEANAAAFVASPMLKDGRIEENLVFHGLMGSGMSVGQATGEINRLLPHWGFEVGKALVLGDPSMTTGERLPEEEEQPFKKGLQFGVMDEAPEVPDDECCLDGPQSRAVVGFVRGGMIPHGRAALVDRAIDTEAAGPLRIVSRSQTPEAALVRVRQVLDEYDRLALLGVKVDEGRNLLTDLRKNFPNAVRRASVSRCGAPIDPALQRVLDRLREATKTVDPGIVAKLQRETVKSEYHFVEAYRDAYRMTGMHRLDDGCPNCGSDAVRYEFVSFGDDRAHRWMVSCVICGAVQDGVPGFVMSSIEGLETNSEDKTVQGEVVFQSEAPEEVSLAIGGAVTHGKRHGASVTVSQEQVVLSPGGHARVPVEVRVPQPADKHCMFLRMYCVSEGKIGFSGREFFI